jgi:serine/threonine-protein kinase RsbW
MTTLLFPGRYESLASIAVCIRQAALEAGFDASTRYSVEVAVDEACSNIIEHAYGGEDRGEISVTYHIKPDVLEIVLRDWGEPFNPDAIPEPNFSIPLEKITTGGLGLYTIHRVMDEVNFEFSAEHGNVLTLIKKRPG